MRAKPFDREPYPLHILHRRVLLGDIFSPNSRQSLQPRKEIPNVVQRLVTFLYSQSNGYLCAGLPRLKNLESKTFRVLLNHTAELSGLVIPLNIHLISEAAKLVESEVNAAINLSQPAVESAAVQELNSIIFGRYLSNELLCLYAETSAWLRDANNVLPTMTAFEAYMQRVASMSSNGSPGYSTELQIYHEKIMTLAMRLRKAVMVSGI
jgi:hypothetical protein